MKTSLLFGVAGAVLTFAGCAGMQSQGGMAAVVAPGVEVELVQEGFEFTEGPLGAPDGGLYFTDLGKENTRIFRMDPGGKISMLRDRTNRANGLAYTRSGDIVTVEALGRRVSRLASDGSATELSRGDGSNPLLGPNDLIVDSKGGIYFTDPGPRPIVPGRKVHVYYLPAGSAKAIAVDDSMVRPNGLTLTLDGRTLLVADTVEHTVPAFDVQPDGRLRNKRPFIRLQGIKEGQDSGADGMAIDREGRIYVTTVTGVQVFDKVVGEYIGTITVPRRPTNVAFSGRDKRTLYITAREGLYRIQTLTQGPDRRGK